MKAYLFPGQGAQSISMASELLTDFPKARILYEKAKSITGIDFTAVSENDLKSTRITQLAIFLHSIGRYEEEKERCLSTGITESEFLQGICMGGFSLGEYSALCASGVLSLEDTIDLLDHRSLYMDEAAKQNPGGMVAVIGLPDETVEKVLLSYDNIYPVNYNCPGQLVIAGDEENLSHASEELLALHAKRALKLNVSGAFHTKYMSPASVRLSVYAAKFTFHASQCTLYSNVTGEPLEANESFPEYLAKHMISPVRFTHEIQCMQRAGITDFVELGPGKVLTGLVAKIRKSV
ncbi:MAG TPA: ACP S-malonyltransferase [Bacillota bacterium]|nr:ACP S-malonyltransferase [Bacillota bacterium]HPE38223.1 ACP S-malonyltransferase [Bacillota bacterium]